MDFTSSIKRVIQAIPIPLAARAKDKLAWKPSPKREFDLKLAYLLSLELGMETSFKGKWIWKLKTFPRIQSFVW